VKRNLGKPEDFRYKLWRRQWGKNAISKAFVRVYLLQAVIMAVVSLPVVTMMNETKNNDTTDIIVNKLRPRKSTHGKNKSEPLIYVVTPQRLDHNTSGLFVVATKKTFAGYFAKLLRVKTEAHLKSGDSMNYLDMVGKVQKKYRCLVCVQPSAVESKNCQVLGE
jgi:23S rRNA-/tRNA-specific pseudouridylate synthase